MPWRTTRGGHNPTMQISEFLELSSGCSSADLVETPLWTGDDAEISMTISFPSQTLSANDTFVLGTFLPELPADASANGPVEIRNGELVFVAPSSGSFDTATFSGLSLVDGS